MGWAFIFDMIDYELNLNDCIINIASIDDSFPPLEVDTNVFFSFVKDRGMNGYCYDWFDPLTDSHKQSSGYLTYDQYFDSYHLTIKKHLVEYLKHKKLLNKIK
jgi:hypothetical protein